VAHTCNPTHPGGRDQENHSLKPVQANNLQKTISKNLIIKKDWWSGSSCIGPEFKPQHCKKKKLEALLKLKYLKSLE
jgi:hypothetical protein